jgi:hypothetical protein
LGTFLKKVEIIFTCAGGELIFEDSPNLGSAIAPCFGLNAILRLVSTIPFLERFTQTIFGLSAILCLVVMRSFLSLLNGAYAVWMSETRGHPQRTQNCVGRLLQSKMILIELRPCAW